MHEITGNRDEVFKLLKDTIRQLGQDSPKTRKSGMKALSVKTDAQWPSQRDQIIDLLKRGMEIEKPKHIIKTASLATLPNERAVDTWYAPRNQSIALFQAAMDEYLDE